MSCTQLVSIQGLLVKQPTDKEKYVDLFGKNNQKLTLVNVISKDLTISFSEIKGLGGKLDYDLFKYSSLPNNNWVRISDFINFLNEEVSFYEKMKRKISLPVREKELESLREEILNRLNSFRERAEKDLSN